MTKRDISIRFLTENKKVIPLLYQLGDPGTGIGSSGFWVTNIKPPEIVVSNNSGDPVKLCELDLLGRINGDEVIRLKVNGKQLEDSIKDLNPRINAALEDGDPWVRGTLSVRFGKISVPEGGFAEEGVLNPGGCTVIPLSRLLFVHYIGQDKIDDLLLALKVERGNGESTVEFPIQLRPYESKGNYIFPMQGSLVVMNLPMSLTFHRSVLSQEFAFDVAEVKQTREGKFTTTSTSKPTSLDDYLVFGKTVMAIGDGTVVEVGNKFPEARMQNPQEYSEDFFCELVEELLPQIGLLNTLSGNYIVLDHGNDEYSFYAHLSEASIGVDVGDEVEKGDVIAQVGNTGHSPEPHLHFHLMDSQSVFEANGLPVMFENVPATETHEDCVEANSLVYSDFLSVPVSE